MRVRITILLAVTGAAGLLRPAWRPPRRATAWRSWQADTPPIDQNDDTRVDAAAVLGAVAVVVVGIGTCAYFLRRLLLTAPPPVQPSGATPGVCSSSLSL
jgi:hypothetical protein